MRENRSNLWKSVAALGALAAVLCGNLTLPQSAQAQKRNRRAVLDKTASAAAPFTPGNLVVYRVGDGTQTLSNTGNSVFLDEFSPTTPNQAAPVQSIALPTTASGANRQLIASGTATSEGFLTRSADARFLLLAGYARDLGGTGSLPATAATAVPRVIGRVAANGSIDTSTALTDAADANSPRSATSSNGSDLYIVGGGGGIRFASVGATTSTQISTTLTNIRGTAIYNGQLYISTASGSAVRIGTVGSGTPTTAGQTITNLPGFPTNTSPYQFFFADLSSAVAGVDTLYVADDAATTGGIQKYSLVGGNWTANGTIAGTFRGLTATVGSAGSVTVYATRGASGNELVSLADTSGYNATIAGTPVVLATAAANTAFRGVALAPVDQNAGVQRRAQIDFNGDNRTDFSVARDQGGQVVWFNSINGTNEVRGAAWGLPNDFIVPADYDGDQRTDIAVWRGTGNDDPTQGVFFILGSNNNTVTITPFGRPNDDPSVVGDYDGDRKADLAVFRGNAANTTAQFVYRPSGTANAADVTVNFGLGFDFPAPGDYDGDGKNDFAVQRDEGNGIANFYLLKSNGGGTEVVNWGLPSDFVVPGDYDGDGRNDFCVARTVTGNQRLFYVLTRTGAVQEYLWGVPGDVFVPGDYNGDGRTDIAVWRPSSTGESSTFFIRPTNGAPDITYQWGVSSDFPVANFQVQ